MVRFRKVSAPGLLFLVLTVTLRVGRLDHVARPALVFDDLRSPDGRRPGAVGAWPSRLPCSRSSRASGTLAGTPDARHFHDLGKLMLAFVMLWAYLAFSQFLIIWSGNLPEEIPWYIERIRGGWGVVALLLVIGHFALPFALLLSRDLKRHSGLLAKVAIFVIADASGRSDLAGGADVLARLDGRGASRLLGPGALDGHRAFPSAWRVSGCSCLRGSCAVERCCRPTIRTSRRRSRMSHTETPHDDSRMAWTSRTSRTSTSDVDLRPLLGFAVGLFVVTAVVFVLMYGSVQVLRTPGGEAATRPFPRWRGPPRRCRGRRPATRLRDTLQVRSFSSTSRLP